MTMAALLPASSRSEKSGDPAKPSWKRWLRIGLVVLAGGAVFSVPFTAPPLLARLDYFHVRHLEFEGVQYVRTTELVDAIAIDTMRSVWHDLSPIDSAVRAHPLVRDVEVSRRIPSTVFIRIVERTPVALVTRRGILLPTDVDGRDLPIDPAVHPLDLPVAATADSALLGVLDMLQRRWPEMFARIVSARRAGRDHLVLELDSFVVHMRDDVTIARLRDILPVEADLARAGVRAVELDVRFQDQVIVRRP